MSTLHSDNPGEDRDFHANRFNRRAEERAYDDALMRPKVSGSNANRDPVLANVL